jgi:hypothetical protein
MTYGGMTIHLDSGACPSQHDITDLGASAAMCFQWSKFIVDEQVRDAMLQRQAMWSSVDFQVDPIKVECFKCPTCDERFTKSSGLFMHVESPACGQTLDGGAIAKLRKWLANQQS